MTTEPPVKTKPWTERISRSGYFVGAVLLHVIIFVLVATWVVFPAFRPPPDDMGTVTPPPPSAPPNPPTPPPVTPTPHDVDVASSASASPTPPIEPVNTNAHTWDIRIPKLGTATAGEDSTIDFGPPGKAEPKGISPERLKKIKALILASRPWEDVLGSQNDPRNITKAKFPVYLASYADGDWDCNVQMKDGKIASGSLPNLLAKVGEWSHGHIAADLMPTPLNIGSQELLDKKPPFIFFTGHKDFVLTKQEVQNLQDYVEMGGVIWGDNALAGKGSRFDVAFRREMHRVVPNLDCDFKPFAATDDIFTKSWFPIDQVPQGMNYYAEPIEHMDIDGVLAILYTPNDYSDLFSMRILPGDTEIQGDRPDPQSTSPLYTSGVFLYNQKLFFRNFELPSCLACDRLGMNVIGYFLVRFDNPLLLSTP